MITTCFYPLKIPQQKHPVLNRPHVHSTVHLSWLYLTITPMITWLVPLFHFTPGEIHFDWHMFRLINQNTSRLCNTIKATDLGPQMITHLAIHYFSIFRLSLFFYHFLLPCLVHCTLSYYKVLHSWTALVFALQRPRFINILWYSLCTFQCKASR